MSQNKSNRVKPKKSQKSQKKSNRVKWGKTSRMSQNKSLNNLHLIDLEKGGKNKDVETRALALRIDKKFDNIDKE